MLFLLKCKVSIWFDAYLLRLMILRCPPPKKVHPPNLLCFKIGLDFCPIWDKMKLYRLLVRISAYSEYRGFLGVSEMSTEYTIRRFQESDAREVSALIIQTLRTSNSKDYSQEYIEKDVKAFSPQGVIVRAGWTHFLSSAMGL